MIRKMLLASSLAGVLAFGPTGGQAADVKSFTAHYGEETTMQQKILVVYGTRGGSTVDVADAIGKTLAESGASVDVQPAGQVKSVAGYQAVVIGSAIWAGKVLPEVTALVKSQQADLRKVPVAYFAMCLLLKDDTEENRKKARQYLEPLCQQVPPVETGTFAGKMDFAKLGFFSRVVVKYLIRAPEGDFRNWPAITAWAKALSPKLAAGQPAKP